MTHLHFIKFRKRFQMLILSALRNSSTWIGSILKICDSISRKTQNDCPIFSKTYNYYCSWSFSIISSSELIESSYADWRLGKHISTYLGVCVTYRRSMDWILDLLTTCIHHWELQVIPIFSLVSILYKSQHHPLNFSSLLCSPDVPYQRFLAVEILQLPALMSSFHSRPCRVLVIWQLR
jgi:hypothetical protein